MSATYGTITRGGCIGGIGKNVGRGGTALVVGGTAAESLVGVVGILMGGGGERFCFFLALADLTQKYMPTPTPAASTITMTTSAATTAAFITYRRAFYLRLRHVDDAGQECVPVWIALCVGRNRDARAYFLGIGISQDAPVTAGVSSSHSSSAATSGHFNRRSAGRR